jgi:hypothetical protein
MLCKNSEKNIKFGLKNTSYDSNVEIDSNDKKSKIQNPNFQRDLLQDWFPQAMELNEEFKRVVGSIKLLEQQLISLGEKIISDEQENEATEKEIEEHFTRCVNALVARKEVLLKELGEKRDNQSMYSFPLLTFPSLFLQQKQSKQKEDSVHRRKFLRELGEKRFYVCRSLCSLS